MSTFYRPELIYRDRGFAANLGLLVGDDGRVIEIGATPPAGATIAELPGRALLPGFVNAHSHSFQRLIRGRAESRAASGRDFWSWRGTMYHAAAVLSPEQVYDVARMAFLEMALAGITTVGEFHYLHKAPDGRPYDDPNLLAKQVIAAARSVGIRIVLLRSAYLRSGYELARDPGQSRFFETAAEFLANMEALTREHTAKGDEVRLGLAPHSVRAVPLEPLTAIVAWGRDQKLPVHMHVSEQVAENEACVREHGLTPLALLGQQNLLAPDFTAVHSIHLDEREQALLAASGASICACPTTERNLGDGIFPAHRLMAAGVPVALGSDSQAQIDPLEDARELDYHLRLSQQRRAILDQINQEPLASQLFACATANGARALALPAGDLRPGSFADFFTVDRNDLSVAGHSAADLLSILVFSLSRAAIRDVVVNGRVLVRDGAHPLREEIVARFNQLHRWVWVDGVEAATRS